MTHLTPQAEQALQAVRDKHKEYKERKALIEAEVRATLQDRLNALREERDGAIRLAVEAGVPRTRLGEAIGTSNYRTIQEILASTENMVRQSDGWALVKTGGNTYPCRSQRWAWVGLAVQHRSRSRTGTSSS